MRFHFSVVIVPQRVAVARPPVWQQMRRVDETKRDMVIDRFDAMPHEM
jgi:hypothetical protein